MRKLHGKYGVLGVLVIALLLGLLLMAGPASATSVSHTQSAFMGELFLGSAVTPLPDGGIYTENWVAYGICYRATGVDGWRLPGYFVVRFDVTEPLKGDNYHVGDFVIMSEDPSPLAANGPSDWEFADFVSNFADYGPLWAGSWDGMTLNKYNHKATVHLTGLGPNDGWKADIENHSGVLFPANWHADNWFGTSFNGTALITTL